MSWRTLNKRTLYMHMRDWPWVLNDDITNFFLCGFFFLQIKTHPGVAYSILCKKLKCDKLIKRVLNNVNFEQYTFSIKIIHDMCKSVDDLKSVIKHQTPCIKYQSYIYIIYRQNVLTLKKNTTIIPTCIFTNYICIFSCCKLYFTIFLVVNTRYSRHSVGSVAYKTQNAQNIFLNIIALYIYK